MAPADERSEAGNRRRTAILEAAYELFMDKGYESVAIDDIIRAAGGSKSTLYKYFGNKEGVLRAVVSSLAEDMIEQFELDIEHAGSVRESLRRIGRVLAELALSEHAIQQFRQSVAHANSFPDIARLWYEAGPRHTMIRVAEFLEREHAAGRLQIDDPTEAAWFFASLVIFRDNMTLLIGMPPRDQSQVNTTVERAVNLFLAHYGT